MPSVCESSIASSCQASPHTKVPPVPQEPINPEIMVLPVVPSSPVASSSPAATEPVAESNSPGKEAKAKKGGRPSPSPSPRSPIDEAQQEPSPHPRSLLPAASLCGSPKPTLPEMPVSKPSSEHQPSPPPLPTSPKMPDSSTCHDPHFQIHSVHQTVYRKLIESPEPRLPLSADQMNLLQIGADDLNYWGYTINIMYRQLLETDNPVQQITLIMAIVSMFHQQNDFAIANACQEMDFPETRYIFQLRSAIMRWFQDSNFPKSHLPSNVVKISMGPYLKDFDLSLLLW
ncbi:hypothetical protein C8J56DRAFT_1043322 [Mycena floridula]|nr:hypothetical protein C8J56DRAFT_1043322 [Mycena floridula]